jgi:diadenosine tetraphosphate (Ap4A) HIT family hydrolase
VKPERHVTAVADLTDAEAAELGGLLRQASRVASTLVGADQVYNCLWSHAGGKPVHIHCVVQPVTREQMDQLGAFGPTLEVAMFEQRMRLPADAVEEIAARASKLFAER